MSPETATKYVSWIWIVGALMMIVMLFGGYILNGMGASIVKLQDNKMDRSEYLKDHNERREDIRIINQKLDAIPELIARYDIKLRGINTDVRTSWKVRREDK